MSDPWDELVNPERQAYLEGWEEGRQAAKQGEERDRGRQEGFKYGFAFHMEVCFMEKMAQNLLQLQTNFEEENAEGTSNSWNESRGRIKKKCQHFLSQIDKIPLANSKDVDFIALLGELRSSYRSIKPDMTKFSVEAQNQMEW